MNSKKPVHFSDHFNIDKARLNELGVFDPILNFDTKVFVEPLLLKDSSSEIIRNSYQTYKTFFANLLLLLQKSNYVGDKCWRTAKRMVKDNTILTGYCEFQRWLPFTLLKIDGYITIL